MEHEFPLKHSVRKKTTFSDVPLLQEIFRWIDPKHRVPFTFQPGFPETFFANCKPSNTVTLIFRYVSPLMRDLYYNHREKSWDSCTVRTLFNTGEIISAHFQQSTSLSPSPTPQTVLKLSRHNSFDLSTLYWVGRGEGTWKSKKTALLLRHNLLNV